MRSELECDDRRARQSNCQKATPQDAADFGRCKRLLDAIPEWKSRLGEVAEAYKDTAWPRIVAKWSELETATAESVNEILRECHNDPSSATADAGRELQPRREPPFAGAHG